MTCTGHALQVRNFHVRVGRDFHEEAGERSELACILGKVVESTLVKESVTIVLQGATKVLHWCLRGAKTEKQKEN
jgi:hypothetical protein